MGGSTGRSEGGGSVDGSAPMGMSGFGTTVAAIATTAMPTRDPGIAGWIRGHTIMHATTITAAPSAHGG